MASTWNKLIAGLALIAVVGSQLGLAAACPNRRRVSAAPASVPAAVVRAPVVVAPVPVAPVAVAPAPVTPASVVEADGVATTAIDLKVFDIRMVDNGNDEQGPSYRLTVKNVGRSPVTSEITVALLASMEKDSDDNLSVLGALESLEAGATKSVDLRLPKGAEVLTYLTAAAAAADVTDADETDNVAVFEREAVEAIR